MGFKPRLIAPAVNDPRFTTYNPYYQSGVGMPNCTCYAWGRAMEILKRKPNLPDNADAEDWYSQVTKYKKSTKPTLGAILCLADGQYSGNGHVCVVEKINADGTIVTSNSAYNGSYFYLSTLTPPSYLPDSSYTFQGFINIPVKGLPIWMTTRKNGKGV